MANSSEQNGAPEHLGIGATEGFGRCPNPYTNIPIVEVAFNSDKWWSMPEEMSGQLYEKYINGQDGGYAWDWGPGGRRGSWEPDG